MRRKIVLVGAGSAVFTKGLLLDIIERRDEQWSVGLVDTDPVALDVIDKLSRKMVEQKGADIELSASVDRRDILPGADYVVSTIGVGGRRAWEQDVFIPRKYGVYQPVGDTVGPGGLSRAMRMIPQLCDIARDIKIICPDALFLNYANPMTMNCMAIRRETGVPVIGLCHGVNNGLGRISRFMGLRKEDISFTACGLNHMVFLYQMRKDAKDLFPYFVEMLDKVPVEERQIGPLTENFVRENHSYVVSDDRHYSEFVPETTLQGAYRGGELGVKYYSFEGTIREGDEEFEEHRRYAYSAETLPESFFERESGEHEQLMDIIGAMIYDRPGIFYVNLPNCGAVAGLPDETVVERPALISGSGIQPLQLPDFPVTLLPRLARFATIYEMAVRAALEGDRGLLLGAMCEASAISDKETVRKMMEELLAAQKEYLPQF